jgi:2-oxo-3-hexenedioate decarboxylase
VVTKETTDETLGRQGRTDPGGRVSDAPAVARELARAFRERQLVPTPPSARGDGFDLTAAYAVEAELAGKRRGEGRTTVGIKVGYANKAMWRVLKLDTLVWAHMYDDTVQYADTNEASLSISHMISPKIEPEIVFRMKTPLGGGVTDAAGALEAVEWLALGFEIIDCPYVDWKFQPADFVAAYGLHAALIVGQRRAVTADTIPELVEQLPAFKVRLSKDGELVTEGAGKNALRSPALCLAELASAMAKRSGAEPLAAGDLVSSGTLTESTPIQPGATWTAAVEGIELPFLSVRLA